MSTTALHQQQQQDEEEEGNDKGDKRFMLRTNEATNEESNKISTERTMIPTAQRWRVLFSFAVLSMSSAWIWITWSPIVRPAASFWKVPLGHVDALAGIYLYVYVPCSFLSLYLVVNYLGLHRGLFVGAAFNATGAIVRYKYLHSYSLVYMGTLLCAVAQTFTLSAPPLIAANWFQNSERATATGLGVLANQLGTAMGLGATILVDFSTSNSEDSTSSLSSPLFLLDESKLRTYLGLQACTAIIALVLVYKFGGDEPSAKQNDGSSSLYPTEQTQFIISSPQEYRTRRTNQDNRPKYVESIGHVFSNFHNTAYMLSFGMAVGVFYTIPAFISQLTPISWSPRSNGWLGVTYQVLGAYTSFQAGRTVDASQQHRMVCLLLLFVATVSLTVLMYAQVSYQDETWQTNCTVYVFISLVGSSLAAWNSVGLEFGTGICHPANEAAVGGVLEASAEMFGFVWVLLGGKLIEIPTVFLSVLAIVVATSFVILWQLNIQMKRWD